MKRSHSFTDQTMAALKARVMARGITQAQLAAQLEVSLPTLKRWLAGKSVTLTIVKQICDQIGLSFSELIHEVENAVPARWQYSMEQEEFLAENPDCLAFFDHLLQGRSAARIQRMFRLSPIRTERLLSKLEKAGLIEWLPRNRTRLLVTGEPVWQKDGPLARRFKSEMLSDFLSQPDGKHFMLSEVLPEDLEPIGLRIKELLSMIRKAGNKALLRPEDAQSHGTFLQFRTFRWQLDSYLGDRYGK